MKNKEYELMFTEQLISIRADLEKTIDKLIFDHNEIVDVLNKRKSAFAEEGCPSFSEIREWEIEDFS
jgi:hypothetical protein